MREAGHQRSACPWTVSRCGRGAALDQVQSDDYPNVSGDGVINAVDALLIVQLDAGVISTLPAETARGGSEGASR